MVSWSGIYESPESTRKRENPRAAQKTKSKVISFPIQCLSFGGDLFTRTRYKVLVVIASSSVASPSGVLLVNSLVAQTKKTTHLWKDNNYHFYVTHHRTAAAACSQNVIWMAEGPAHHSHGWGRPRLALRCWRALEDPASARVGRPLPRKANTMVYERTSCGDFSSRILSHLSCWSTMRFVCIHICLSYLLAGRWWRANSLHLLSDLLVIV